MTTHLTAAPLVLEGMHVRLEPMVFEHASVLWEIERDHVDDLRWIFYRMRGFEDFQNTTRQKLDEQQRGLCVPFVTVERVSGQIVGATSFMNMDLANRKVEIGSSWIVPRWQRTPINTAAKYLMLRHAFETWECLRVELKTDAMNQRSRNAILRLGAKEEGTLRKHMITWEGRSRDTIYFSILDTEWPTVKVDLEKKLRGESAPSPAGTAARP